MNVVSSTASDGSVIIRVMIRGKGLHKLALRADGIVFAEASREVYLNGGWQQAVFRGKPVSPKSPGSHW
jgi:hypothetical protein